MVLELGGVSRLLHMPSTKAFTTDAPVVLHGIILLLPNLSFSVGVGFTSVHDCVLKMVHDRANS